MSIKKILVAICLIVLTTVGLSTHAYAQTSEHLAGDKNHIAFVEIEPLWANTAFMSINLHINNNGRATMSGSVVGNVGTTSITVNAVLERVNPNGTFTHIASFNNLRTESDIWVWERTHYVARGHLYRLTLTATVVRHGVSEVVSISRSERAN